MKLQLNKVAWGLVIAATFLVIGMIRTRNLNNLPEDTQNHREEKDVSLIELLEEKQEDDFVDDNLAEFATDNEFEDAASDSELVVDPNSGPVLQIKATNLMPLQEGTYQLWVRSSGEMKPVTTFKDPAQLDMVVLEKGVDIERIEVTIESENDASVESSGIVVVSGISSNLTFNQVPLSTANGQYITGTPSNDPEGFENSGLWFAIPGTPPTASLDLPNIDNAPWIYESFSVHQGVIVSAGKFKNPNQSDDYTGHNGPGAIPNLPGEDFLRDLPGGLIPPIDLGDGQSQVIVTLEPYLEGVDPTGDSPYQIQFLTASIPAGIIHHSPQSLVLDTSSLPFMELEIIE